jgi:hypothetical protein
MEWLGFSILLHFSLINLCENLVVYWPPSIILKSHVPTIMLVVFWFIEMYVDRLFPCFLFDRHIITGCKCIDVDDASVAEDFVVN